METINSRLKDVSDRIGALEVQTTHLSKAGDNLDELKIILNKSFAELDGQLARILSIERFMDKYIPIRIQSQIAETLQSCLPEDYLEKLESYDLQKSKELNQIVLKAEIEEDKKSGLSKEMINLLQEILKGIEKTYVVARKREKKRQLKRQNLICGSRGQSGNSQNSDDIEQSDEFKNENDHLKAELARQKELFE